MRPLPTFLDQASKRGGENLTVLVLRLGALGDILRTLPPVRLLRRALPRARIHWVIDDRWLVALEGHPDLDGIVVLPRREWQRHMRGPRGGLTVLRAIRAFRNELRLLSAGLALDFHGNLRSGLVGWLSKATVRLGYEGHQQKEGNRWLTTHRVASGDRRTPRMDRNLDLIRALGLPDAPLPDGGLNLPHIGSDAAEAIVRELEVAGEFALINPGASRAQAHKKPPAGLLASAGRGLAQQGIAPLVVWGPGEEADARRVVEEPGSQARLAPPTDLATLAALSQRARLFVGGDSGPLHLACAVGCPVLGLYGSTDPRVNGPWGVTSRVVFPPDRVYTGIKKKDRASGGFTGLLPAHVELAVNELLEATRDRSVKT